jgi:WD40 repeat protein
VIKSYDFDRVDDGWNEHMKLNGGIIERLKRSSVKQHIVASGGRDNDLKLWDLNTKSMIFSAKNVNEKTAFDFYIDRIL